MTGVTEEIAARRAAAAPLAREPDAAPPADYLAMSAAIARAGGIFGVLCHARARAARISGFAERVLLLDGVANEPGRAVGPEHFGVGEGECLRAVRAAIVARLDARIAEARALLVGLGASQSSLAAIERAASAEAGKAAAERIETPAAGGA